MKCAVGKMLQVQINCRGQMKRLNLENEQNYGPKHLYKAAEMEILVILQLSGFLVFRSVKQIV